MKRGQVTIFIVLGIVILAIIILFLFIRARVYFGPATTERLQEEFPMIREHVEDCLKQTTGEFVLLIAKQGGYLNPSENTFRYYNGDKISYLCYNIPKKQVCSNRILMLVDMEKDLSKAVKQELGNCLNLESFKKSGYDLTYGESDLIVKIGTDRITSYLTLPITITKGSASAKESEFKASVDYPLGKLYNIAQDILDLETTVGDFETSTYTYRKTQNTGIPYIIQKLQPYPDKLYILRIKDNSLIFQFMVQGE